jgi:hypothetical protein
MRALRLPTAAKRARDRLKPIRNGRTAAVRCDTQTPLARGGHSPFHYFRPIITAEVNSLDLQARADQVSPQHVTVVQKRLALSRQGYCSLAAGHSERHDLAEIGGDPGVSGSSIAGVTGSGNSGARAPS